MPFSTGVFGQDLLVDPSPVPALLVRAARRQLALAVAAIMTTDTVPKLSSRTVACQGGRGHRHRHHHQALMISRHGDDAGLRRDRCIGAATGLQAMLGAAVDRSVQQHHTVMATPRPTTPACCASGASGIAVESLDRRTESCCPAVTGHVR